MIECAKEGQDQRLLAESIKKAVEAKEAFQSVPGKGPWNCIVGGSFSAAVSHERGHSAVVRFPSKGFTVCTATLSQVFQLVLRFSYFALLQSTLNPRLNYFNFKCSDRGFDD